MKEYGPEEGSPALFLHGGPGSGCRAALCRLFPPGRFRIIAPDQRGAGESTPKGRLEENTTQHLIADLEMIREELGIRRWLVVGGSWGALLAVAYAEACPAAVAGIVVRSLFLGTDEELQWAFVTGPRTFYPELYESFTGLLPECERRAPLSAWYPRILHDDPAIAVPAGFVWHDYERALSELRPSLPAFPQDLSAMADGTRALPSTPRMEAHYFSNGCFLEPGQLLDNARRLADIPGIIVQSRYDLLCPPQTAHALSRRWTACGVVTVEAAGHSQSEAGVEQAVAQAAASVADEAGL
ncbi:MAG: alpha/beta fold hydrolase [Gammaproteobacteria bacterium]|nr:alpha/beta fold hydrolase [Gammaproteobacteria bacterium]